MKLRSLAVFLLAVALLLPAILPLSYAAPADTVYVRKHVSFVYDNSGSMSSDLGSVKNLKWSYASYAAQIFAGLLNDTDSLTMTLMNGNMGTKTMEVNLSGDRQEQVDLLRDLTNYAKGGTPFASVYDAEKVLVNKGLLADSQIGDNVINQGEQYWLVLTTDGRFENGNKPKEEIERDLEALLKKYSNLQLVYFGIGTEGDNSAQSAFDFRDSDKLTAYPNFTAVYAEKQEQIVSTMQELANRISGRYSVKDGIRFNGNKVTLRVSGETSPIRNIAILAQKTNTKLLSAVDEDGNELTVARAANEQYPYNINYDNMPEGTSGAHTALITSPDGKFQPGTLTLTFSEPVNADDFSLMYEPAVYVNLTLEQKDPSGNWVKIPYGQKVFSGRPLRVSYEICEDGTNTPIDAAKLPGVTTEHITCGNMELDRNGEFTAPSGNSTITATVSMMDGTYVVSTVRSLQVVSLDDYTFQVSDGLTFYPDELATNSTQYIDFQVFYQGQPATADQLTDFSVDAGDLQGTLTTPGNGIFRFTPKQEGRLPGDMTVNLCFVGQPVASQKVTVKELVIRYEAKAENDLTMFSIEVAANTNPIIFSVTRFRGPEAGALLEEDLGDFRIEAVSADGTVLKGVTAFVGGQLHFTPSDTNAQVGEYTVTLYWKDAPLANAHISLLKYNAQFTAEVFRVGDGTVDWLDLRNNESTLAFVIYADGTPCTAVQLQGMLNSMIQLRHEAPKKFMKLDVSVGTYDGKPALLVRPTSAARNAFGAWFKNLGIMPRLLLGVLKDGPLAVELTVQAEKGTQISGTLDMTHNPADVIWILVVLAIIIVVIGFIVYTVWCCVHKPRIAPGHLHYYLLQHETGGYKLVTRKTEEITWKFSFSTKPETITTDLKLELRAPEPTGKFKPIQRPAEPITVISYTGERLNDYSYHNRDGNVTRFLSILRGTSMKNKIPLDTVNAMTNNKPVQVGAPPKPGKTATYTFRLKSQHLLIRKNGSDKDHTVEVWTYIVKSKQ